MGNITEKKQYNELAYGGRYITKLNNNSNYLRFNLRLIQKTPNKLRQMKYSKEISNSL